ncbi:MAG: lipoyl synthase [Lentimicrobiaceae bacterium]|jgi:lipoic acid synthetase|nr:lipoyl synthase [Lentimicrobiaceae bacterium]
MNPENEKPIRKPAWLKIKLPKGENFLNVSHAVSENRLHTICKSGNCPNQAECWEKGTATLMILGNTCTRNCHFCAVDHGKPMPPDSGEPARVAETVKLMQLKHCVLTSVTRDDLSDGGAALWAETIRKVKKLNPQTTIEALIPDFNGDEEALQIVIDSRPEILSHNLETVERLTPVIRNRAQYRRSLAVLQYISQEGVTAKSGIMLGLGETEEEVLETMNDLLDTGCGIFTLGQYLRPTLRNIAVAEYIHPDVFEKYRKAGLAKGFRFVESGPFVRSSYHAENHL